MSKANKEMATRAPDQLGVAIRRIRKAKGLTQEQLAKKSGIQQRTISKVENGQLNTEVSTIFAICAALGAEILLRDKPTTSKKKLAWVDD